MERGITTTAAQNTTMPMRWAPAGVVRPASGAAMALGAISEAKITATMSVFVVPSCSAATDGPNAW